MATSHIERFGLNEILMEVHSRNISVQLLSKYLKWDINKSQFSIFPLQVNGTIKLPQQPKRLSNGNKNDFCIG